MSHQIYNTDGFVISSQNRGDSDRLYFIFTKDLGLIRAVAAGVRKLESKLRYSLQDFAYSNISLVLGKTGWRIVNSHYIENPARVFTNSIKVKSLRLLKKVCPEDEANQDLWLEIVSAFDFIDSNKDVDRKSLEALLVLKILSKLGYWGEEKGDSFVSSPFTKDSVDRIEKQKKQIIKSLNESLRATQLI